MEPRRAIVAAGLLAGLTLVLCGAVVYSMRTGGVPPDWSHTYQNGITVWTGYRVPVASHRAHPLAAMVIWLGAALVTLGTVRFWAISREPHTPAPAGHVNQ
jgi:hypothetical protein